jgi:hypothetical protein
LASYVAVSWQWDILIKLPYFLGLDFSEKMIKFITIPGKRLLGKRISLGFSLRG